MGDARLSAQRGASTSLHPLTHLGCLLLALAQRALQLLGVLAEAPLGQLRLGLYLLLLRRALPLLPRLLLPPLPLLLPLAQRVHQARGEECDCVAGGRERLGGAGQAKARVTVTAAHASASSLLPHDAL